MLSSNATSYAPPPVSSKGQEKMSSSELEGPVTGKAHAQTHTVNTHGRPGSSASSNSECAGAVSASGGRGLSPSSSLGSLSSEKSTLNPNAKVCDAAYVLLIPLLIVGLKCTQVLIVIINQKYSLAKIRYLCMMGN